MSSRPQIQDAPPLIYVGVTLERPASGSWGMTLFRMSDYLVVGGVQQVVMQGFTSWAWATTAPPKSRGDFRSSFGPLYYTSLLQLVPGDVILSINGQSQLDPFIWHAPRLDVLAVRMETTRRAAHDVLCTNVEHVEFRAAQAAFQGLEPLLPQVIVPKACQRRLIPVPETEAVVPRVQAPPTPSAGIVNENSSFGSSAASRDTSLVSFL